MRKSSGTWLLAPLNSLGLIGSGIGCMALLVVLLIGLSLSLFASLFVSVGGTHQAVGNSAIITQTARTMAAQLQDCREMTTPQARENSCGGAFPRYAALTPAFPPSLLQWGRSHCGASCAAWESGNFQCVSFVLAAYALAHPLDFSGNGNQFWGLYTTSAARAKGYQTVATGTGLPLAPGDIMAWSGGAFGHVSIVLSWQAPSADTPGKIAFAS
ncbi:MAG: CHAP domain-containing protein, partial [Ktedonobacteraceae bacterium]|nr:CHAP domain-containing protein [Ktedonobacteraceae bacterium]